tara:strand:+ start:80 stop:721 length:642 start_codon:yes stop_codon:yes gene_type:complete
VLPAGEPIYVKNAKKSINEIMNPTEILKAEYQELNNAITDGGHEYHCFYLATVYLKTPSLRTVVLRSFNKNKNSLSFHTDLRSNKIKEIKSNDNISALFYNKKRKVQIRMRGKAVLLEDSIELKTIWSKMRPESKLCYMGPFAPGQILDHFQPNLPNHNAQNISTENHKKGYKNFCRVTIQLDKLDWLQLDHRGHRRILFTFDKDSKPMWVAS